MERLGFTYKTGHTIMLCVCVCVCARMHTHAFLRYISTFLRYISTAGHMPK